MREKLLRAISALDNFLKKGPSRRLKQKFLNKSIPINTNCFIYAGNEIIICKVRGYILNTDLNLPIAVILDFRPEDRETSLTINGCKYSIEYLSKRLSQDYTNIKIVEHDLSDVYNFDYEKYYLIASIDRIFEKRLVKIEKKAVKLKIPTINDQGS